MMGFMTLVMSIFSIVPMAISLSNRHYLARVVVYMLKRYGRPSGEDEQDSDQVSLCRTNEMLKLNLSALTIFVLVSIYYHFLLVVDSYSRLVLNPMSHIGIILSLHPRRHLNPWSSGGRSLRC